MQNNPNPQFPFPTSPSNFQNVNHPNQATNQSIPIHDHMNNLQQQVDQHHAVNIPIPFIQPQLG